MSRPDFVARLAYKTAEQGGRRGPAKSGYHPQIKFGAAYFAGMLEVGMRFEVREGARVTALGEILRGTNAGVR